MLPSFERTSEHLSLFVHSGYEEYDYPYSQPIPSPSLSDASSRYKEELEYLQQVLEKRDEPHWELQSSVAPVEGQSVTTTTNETVTFHDAGEGERGGYESSMAAIGANDQTKNIDFVRFLSRPVRIGSFVWNESDAVATSHTFNPWNLYFTDARVQYKLNNFAFLRCKLKVKILVNASPFYYGAMYCGYQPLQNFTPSTIVSDSANNQLIPYSQRPHVWIYPHKNEGAEMELPFFFPLNWLNAQAASDMTNVGQLTFLNYTSLQSANGATGTGVTISIYAWAEDVELSGPTVGLATQAWQVQSKDEYGQGSVSRPASIVATAAKSLSNIPVIGSFAKATEIGASAVSSIAKLFGFTNVPVISDIMPYQPRPFPSLASTEIGFPVEKLTVDSKNELSVSNSILGLKDDDELAIPYLVQKESYITTATWASSNAADVILFSSIVTPVQYNFSATATTNLIQMVPMCWISNMFTYWRGDIIFRFVVVASAFHKGRLRFSFDPAGTSGENIISDATSNNVVFTEILDLGDSNEVELRIPFQQAVPYLYNDPVLSASVPFSTSSSPTYLHDRDQDNGTITMRVLTALTAPIASSSVNILVFVRGAENLEFAGPRSLPGTSGTANPLTTWNVQSKETVIGTAPTSPDANQNLINFGETVRSLRTVLRRNSLTAVQYIPVITATYATYWRKFFTKFPLGYGYDPNGIHLANGLVSGTSKAINLVYPHPIPCLLPAFVGVRGSVNWTFNLDSRTPTTNLKVSRYPEGSSNATGGATVFSITGSAPSTSTAAFKYLAMEQGGGGSALTNQLTNAGLAVQCPMYSNYLFESSQPARWTLTNAGDGSFYDMYVLEMTTNSAGNDWTSGCLWQYAGIGTDFNPVFFLNVPSYYSYIGTITPN